MAPTIKRSALTKALIDALKGDILLGRGTAPPSGGWPRGQAAATDEAFVPYLVITTGEARSQVPAEPRALRGNPAVWMCRYRFTYHHTSDSSVDDFADGGRDLVMALNDVDTFDLEGVAWRIQEVDIPVLGRTENDDSTSPAHWRLTDDVSLHLSRVSRT